MTLTIPDVSEELMDALRKQAAGGQTPAEVARALLLEHTADAEALGEPHDPQSGKAIGDKADAFMGGWVEDLRFDEAVAEFRAVEPIGEAARHEDCA